MCEPRPIAVVLLVAGAVIVAGAATASEPASLKGVLTANGTTVELPYVYAFPEETGFFNDADPTWTVLFVDRAIAERELDEPLWESAYIRLGITRTAEFGDQPELRVYSQDMRFSAEQPGNVSGGSYPTLELEAIGPDGVSGRVFHAEPQEIFDDTFHYDFTFSAPMSDPDAPIGDPLPAGGGEPGAAFIAWTEAIHSGDIDRLKTLVPPEQAAMLDGPDIAEELEFMKLMTPTDIEITGGSSDGETAVLQVAGKMDGEPVKGEVTLARLEGLWVSTNASWE
jgi:hypothetical protein